MGLFLNLQALALVHIHIVFVCLDLIGSVCELCGCSLFFFFFVLSVAVCWMVDLLGIHVIF